MARVIVDKLPMLAEKEDVKRLKTLIRGAAKKVKAKVGAFSIGEGKLIFEVDNDAVVQEVSSRLKQYPGVSVNVVADAWEELFRRYNPPASAEPKG